MVSISWKKNTYFFLWILFFNNILQPKTAYAHEKHNSLITLIKQKKLEQIKKTLNKNKIMIHRKDSLGNTPLHYAVVTNQIKIVKLLLREKTNFLAINSKGKSPKKIAEEKGFYEILELFKKKIEKNRRPSKTFQDIFENITAEKPHCCQFYGQLRENNHIKILLQITMPKNGDCNLADYNPPQKNLFSGDCNKSNTYEGCRGHTQRPGTCKIECGWGKNPSCNFTKTFTF